MVRTMGFVFCCLVFIVMNGCASTANKQGLEMQGLRNQISVLEAKIQNKDREIESLRDALNKTSEEKAAPGGLEVPLGDKKISTEVNVHPSVVQIQTALKNAGYDPGVIDGKLGKKTREAVKAFQGANNLKVDGKVGSQTWGMLKDHLNK
ncbi:MAG: peptidoglycan-binding domain-containing protein [Candidatus Omnitrophica bacterium]|nr:peptidoglycan-binding domain-containing protein [Candidatus Omnitrophota bacterium]